MINTASENGNKSSYGYNEQVPDAVAYNGRSKKLNGIPLHRAGIHDFWVTAGKVATKKVVKVALENGSQKGGKNNNGYKIYQARRNAKANWEKQDNALENVRKKE
ncbi:hypothetical protein [Xenorhabdus doucetiae]|uniref:hypothetical protein n=1 Tax=Xenorhabdus doucetiae TaxID=351671 RepID=UPI002B40EFA3|nr:hypothetical protein [Xenorhabdus sp. 18]